MTTDERLREIREREAKATAGPWNHELDVYDDDGCIQADVFDRDITFLLHIDTEIAPKGGAEWEKAEASQQAKNAAFIAAARTDIPWLLSQVDALRRELTTANQALREYKGLAESLDKELAAAREECERLLVERRQSSKIIAGLTEKAADYEERAEKAEAECKDREEALYVDETGMFETLRRIRKEISSYSWLLESRGPYEWDDDRYKDEAGRCMQAVDKMAAEAEEKSRQRFRSGDKKLQGVGEPYRKVLAEVATLREQLAKASQGERWRLLYPQLVDKMRRVYKAMRERAEKAEADIANAVKYAKEYCPDYPWKDNTASEVMWALGEGYRGVSQACAEWEEKCEKAEAEQKQTISGFRSRLNDLIRRIGPARRPEDIKAALEEIYNSTNGWVDSSAERAAAESAALAERMREVLREVEWSGVYEYSNGDKEDVCPVCECSKACGHKPDCRLAAVLTLAPSAAPPKES